MTYSIARILMLALVMIIAATDLCSALASDYMPAHPSLYYIDGVDPDRDEPKPLPLACVRVTSSGGAEPVCCLSGVVWLNGEAIEGAG